MIKVLFTLCCFALSFSLSAQDKVKWEITYNSDSQTILFQATIADGWHLYSQNIGEGIGPVPTEFVIDKKKKSYKTIGETIEPEPITEYDKNFEGELSFFKGKVTFEQKLKVKQAGELTGHITFMLCDDEMCLPPVDYTFKLMIDKNEK